MKKSGSEASRLAAFIATLSKAEKRYFRDAKPEQGEEVVYLEIFDYLEAHPQAGNEEFRAHFRGRPFLRNVSSALHYLEGRLVRSLAAYHRSRFPSLSLREELEAAKVLLFRGYTLKALKRLRSIAKRAQAVADPFVLPEALYWKAKAISRDPGSADMLAEMVDAVRERQQVMGQMSTAAQWEHGHTSFIQQVVAGGREGNAVQPQQVRHWMQHEAPPTHGDFESEYYRLWLLSRITRVEGNREESHATRKGLMQLMGQSPEWCQMHAHAYTTLLTNLCNSASVMGDEESFLLALTRLREFRSLDPDLAKLVRLQTLLAELNHFMERLDYGSCMPLMREAGQAFDAAQHLLIKPNEILFLYFFSVACFGNQMHRDALKWMRRILETTRPTNFMDAHCRIHVLRLAVHHESGNWEQVLKVGPASLEFLRRQGEGHTLELRLASYLIDYARAGGYSAEQEREALDALLAQGQETGGTAFHPHHLRAWIRARRDGVSFAEGLRRERGKGMG